MAISLGEIMRILMIGDVVGRPGRQAIPRFLPGIRQQYEPDMVIANAENSAGGLGITPETAEELLGAGIDVLTSGNHIWAKRDIIPCLDGRLPILRPLNYPPGVPGNGYLTRGRVMVVNLMGRTFMGSIDCPFRAMDGLLAELGRRRMTNVLVEGGGRFLGSLLDAGSIDEVHVFLAPKLVGGSSAVSPMAGDGIDEMSGALLLDKPEVRQVDSDVYVHGPVRRA